MQQREVHLSNAQLQTFQDHILVFLILDTILAFSQIAAT